MRRTSAANCLGWVALLCVGATAQEFEVASIKANRSGRSGSDLRRSADRIEFDNASLREWIAFAYGVGEGQDYALSGPAWLASEHYDLIAKAPPATPKSEVRLMLRRLLAERFELEIHRESRQLRVYALTVAPGGPKLRAAPGVGDSFTFRAGHISARTLSMTEFANRLSGPVFQLGIPVLDATGLAGTFDFVLDWAPNLSAADDESRPSLFTALREQLGLRLQGARRAVPIWVIDHVARVPVEQ